MKKSEKNYDELFNSKKPAKSMYKLMGMSIPKFMLCNILFYIKAIPIMFAPVFIAEVIRMAATPDKFTDDRFIFVCIFFMVVLVINIPAHYFFISIITKGIRRMEYTLRSSLARRLQELSISFHSENEKGFLQTKILRDVENLVMSGQLFFQMGIGAVHALITSFVICYISDHRVALFFLIIGPTSAWIIRKFRAYIQDLNSNYRKNVETMSSRMNDMLNLITVTRAHGGEDFELEYLDNQFEEVRDKGINLDKGNGFFASIVFVILHFVLFAVISIVGWIAYKGHIGVDKIALYYGLFAMIVASFQQCMGMLPIFTKGFDSMESIAEILESPDIEQNKDKKVIEDIQGDISFKNVSFCYDDSNKPVIKNFSLDIKKGECIAFVGESGSGKSTLMNMLIGFSRPNSGKILLDNENMESIDMRTFRRHIAVVPQTTSLLTGTIYENISYGNKDFSRTSVKSAAKAANLHEFIISLPDGYDTLIGENGVKLSGGQRQRVAIARAVVRQPKMIILDEATAALDTISEKEVQEAINRLIAERTTLIVAHRLSTIRNADKIIVMKKGICIEKGTHEELLAKKGEFYKLKKQNES